MKAIIFLIGLLTIPSIIYSETNDFYPQNKAEKLIISTLKEKDIEIGEIIPVYNTTAKSEPIVIYKCNNSSGKTFYSIFTQAKGRYDFFDYLIIASNEFNVIKISIIKYRSEHGGEIASKKWLEQFNNYSSGELKYGEDISALSGATISASSITADIPKVLEILKKSCK